MDHDPSRRQYVPQTYGTQPSQQQQDAQAQGQYGTPGNIERFRQSSYLQQSPASATSAGRTAGDVQQAYSFTPSAQYGAGAGMQTSPMQYTHDVQNPETQRQQTQQQYSQYLPGVMYSTSQPQSSQAAPSAYDQMSQYRQRTSGGPDTLAPQFGVPPTGQYYLAGQPGPTSVPSSDLSSLQNMPSQYAQPETYPQPGPSLSHSYPSTMMDPSQSTGYTTYPQQSQYAQAPQPESDGHEFDRYSNQIRSIFSQARDGTLRDIGQQLLEVSHFLLGNAELLGLTRDDEQLHDNRIRLWDEFNQAWLVTLQRQYDLTNDMLQSNTPLRDPLSLMSATTLERLSQELVRMCDGIERHGLVDYQMGVAEEEIIDLILRCLSLLRPDEEAPREAGLMAESSAAGASRTR